MAGGFRIAGGKRQDRVAVLNPDGSADESFNMPDSPTWEMGPATIWAVSVQNDNKIVIAGNFDRIGTALRKGLARLNPDGTVDETFDVGVGFDGTTQVLRILPDGKILVGGQFWRFNGSVVGALARLNSDGTRDASFAPVTTTDRVPDLDIQSDGKIVIVGYKVMRLNANGTIDPTFDVGNVTNSPTQAVKIQPDGKVLVGGSFVSFAGSDRSGVVRLDSGGAVDPTFTAYVNRGSVQPTVHALDVYPNGQVVIAGKFQTVNDAPRRSIARINQDGTLDSAFVADLSSFDDSIYSAKTVQGHKVLVGGLMSSINGDFRVALALLGDDGRAENAFDQGVSDIGLIQEIRSQPGGKVLIGGAFTHVGGRPSRALARLNPDGSLDTTFDIGTGVAGSVGAIGVQADGKIVLGGGFSSYNGRPTRSAVRLNVNGTFDDTFAQDWINSSVHDLVIQPDGKIVFGGSFFRNIIRLNADGTPDSQFSIDPWPSGDVDSVALQPDGRILIAGNFMRHGTVTRNRIARLNPNGTLDSTFDPGSGFNGRVLAIALQADGKIVCVGDFSTANGTGRNRVARLNPDGSLDTTFDLGSGANASVRTVAIIQNSDLILGGDFTQFNGVSRNRLARVSSSGSLRADFAQSPIISYADPLNFGPRVHSLAAVGDKIVAGGIFDTVDQQKFASLLEFVPAFSTLTGRVTTPSGQGLRNATVILTGNGGVRRTATTSSFGIFVFSDVPGGSTYTLMVASKRYRFQPRTINAAGNVADLVLTGLE